MILGAVEGPPDEQPDGQEDGEESAVTSVTEPGVEAGLEPAPDALAALPPSGAAEVRERDSRYPHRVSRRMRRRMRSPQGEAPEQSRAVESPVRAEAPRIEERTVSRPNGQQPSIAEMLKEGQEIIVQIAKEPLGQKGARITSHVALPGRYVVYMPTLEHMGVSRKIGSDEERLRLKRVLQGRRPGPVGGFITRTAAEGRSEEEIAADMEFLYKLWQDIRQKADRKPAPLLLHHDLDIVQRVLRDQLTGSFKAIWIDNEELYENVVGFVQRFQPALIGKVKLYTREAPIFDAFGITAELEKALRPKVWLKSGGYIVINQTEALVAIDVNTGKFVGKSNRLEDTIVKTNTEAIKEIVRQVRLRDLGGIIVIDFIDMDERKNRQKVMQALEEGMRADRAPYKILQFNDFGLVAITRKRVKQSLERTLCAPCPHCEGAGYIKSVQTVVSEILTEARKMAASVEGKDVMLRVHPDVAKVLKSHQNKYLEELEEVLRRPVMVKSDPLLHHEKFDLA
jgi:ribonuclease G